MCDGTEATGYLARDVEEIALILSTPARPPSTIEADISVLLSIGCIKKGPNGLYNDRALREIAYRVKKRKDASKAGKASGKARQPKAPTERSLNGRSTDAERNVESIVYSLESKDVESKVIPKSKKTTTRGGASGNTEGLGSQDLPLEEIADAYHRILPTLPECSEWTSKRRHALLHHFAKTERRKVAWWEEYFGKVAESDFMTGEMTIGIDWLLDYNNVAKVIEGTYKNKPKKGEIDWSKA